MANLAAVAIRDELQSRTEARTLVAVFDATVRRHGHRTAVICGEETLTYAELDHLANRLAVELRALGIGPGSFVAVWLKRSSEVYVAILALLKTGAAYIPLDPGYPSERIQFIAEDAKAELLLTQTALAAAHGHGATPVFCLDDRTRRPARLNLQRSPAAVPSGDAAAYVIYTSGSTGKPKGVVISQTSAVHLVEAEAEIFGLGAHDRVFQGFSVAFDASVEEIWLAFRAGAALVVGTDEVMQLGPGLHSYLTQMQVTAWSTVPTLLAMQEGNVASLRLLILGGEACSRALVERWWRRDLRLVNTYGPTEATVIATYADCYPNQPVTIGKALPGYRLLVVDEALKPKSAGEPGELLISGPGVALGYLNRPELNSTKFINLALAECFNVRFYRTGDLVRFNRDGNLEFLGRIDDQVKIRGFRIELGEIEAALLSLSGVKAAAAVVHAEPGGGDSVVGYIVQSAAAFDARTARAALHRQLPPYMVPSRFVTLEAMPVLPSGKTDRRQLYPPAWGQAPLEPPPLLQAATPLERQLLTLWQELLGAPVATLDEDFFALGGHSLLATKMISLLRKDPALAEAAVLDLYKNPTVRRLAQVLRERQTTGQGAAASGQVRRADTAKVQTWPQRLLGSVVVAGGFYLLYTLLTLSWVSIYFGIEAVRTTPSLAAGLGLAAAAFAAVLAVQLVVPVAVKWLVIGRFKAGRYPVWSSYYWRFWLVRSVLTYFGPSYLSGTPWLPLYYRLLGAKIGKDVYLDTDELVASDLVAIGDGASLNADVRLLGYTLEAGFLVLGPVTIGAGAVVGARSVLQPHSSVGANAELGQLSLLPSFATVPPGAVWAGSPAKEVSTQSTSPASSALQVSPRTSTKTGLATLCAVYAALAFVAMLVPVVAFTPVFASIGRIEQAYGWRYGVAVTPLLMGVGVVLMCLLVAGLKWLVLGRVKAGSYALHGAFYRRKWFVDLQLGLSLNLLSPMYATVFLPHWLRLLGAKIGKDTEISTAANMTPDLLHIDDECFVADDVCLGAAEVRRGVLSLAPVQLGKSSFTGNSAVIAGGQQLAAGCLVGCLTAAPKDAAAFSDSSWMGSPAVLVPKREDSRSFNDHLTYKPPLRLKLMRTAIECLRITLPGSVLITLSRLFSRQIAAAFHLAQPAKALLLLPLQLMGWGLVALALVLASKWLLVGRYQAGAKPLWSSFVWRTELVNAMHEQLGEFFLTGFALGTPLMAVYFRLLGVKIGRGVVLDTSNMTEFDLVQIGDRAVVGWSSDLQTHLFEDRVMKMGRLNLGAECTVGEATLILYDSVLQPRAVVGGLSLVMKGETIPATGAWEGIPVRLARRKR